MDNSNLIYHYTSFEKLQCILKYGTLRFKESTISMYCGPSWLAAGFWRNKRHRPCCSQRWQMLALTRLWCPL